MEVGKICDFRLKSPFTLEMARDMPTVAMKTLIVNNIGGRSIRVGSYDPE